MKVLAFCADLLRLAEHYGMTNIVLKKLESYILGLGDIWELIPKQSIFFMMLGYHLRSTALFRDALKHAIGLNIISSKISSAAIAFETYYADWIPGKVIELAQIGHAIFLGSV